MHVSVDRTLMLCRLMYDNRLRQTITTDNNMTLRWMVINIVNFACQEGAPNANHYFNQFQPQRLFHNEKIVVECQCHMFVLLLH